MDLYTASFALESLEECTSPHRLDRRFEQLELVLERAAADSRRAVVVTPAGFLRIPDPDLRDGIADRLTAASMRWRVALVAGVDVLPDEGITPWGPQPDSYLAALDRGRTLLWPLGRHDSPYRPEPVITIDEVRVGLVVSQDLFDHGVKREMARLAPHLIVLPTHTTVTDRWEPALAKWSRVAPVVTAEPLLSVDARRRRKSALELERRLLCQTGGFALHRHLLRHAAPPTDQLLSMW